MASAVTVRERVSRGSVCERWVWLQGLARRERVPCWCKPAQPVGPVGGGLSVRPCGAAEGV